MITNRLKFVMSLALCLGACQTVPEEKGKPSKEAQSKPDHFEIGNRYAKDGLMREAVKAYRKALERQPQHIGARRNLGMVCVKIGRYRRAIFHLRKVIEPLEKDFETNFYLAEAYRARTKYADAIYHYRRALEVKEEDPKTLKALAWSFYKIRYYSQALKTSVKLRKLTPDDHQGAVILARTLLKLQRPQKALTVIRKAEALSKKEFLPFLKSVEGDILYKLEAYQEAVETYRDALKEQPLLAGALVGIGQAMLKVGGNPAKAIKYMERAIRIKPRLTEAHYFLGRLYEKTDQKKALRYYRRFRQQAATDPEFLERLASVKTKIDQLQKKDKR